MLTLAKGGACFALKIKLKINYCRKMKIFKIIFLINFKRSAHSCWTGGVHSMAQPLIEGII